MRWVFLKKVLIVFKVFFLVIFVLLINVVVRSDVSNFDSKASERVVNLSLMAMNLDEQKTDNLYEPLETFSGDLTGYGANCPLCNGTLACRPSYNVLDGTSTYVDASYGEVNIVASSKNLACGSIVQFDFDSKSMVAIVLDRGVLGSDLDLLVPSEAYASKYVGRHHIEYNVLRKGWSNED